MDVSMAGYSAARSAACWAASTDVMWVDQMDTLMAGYSVVLLDGLMVVMMVVH